MVVPDWLAYLIIFLFICLVIKPFIYFFIFLKDIFIVFKLMGEGSDSGEAEDFSFPPGEEEIFREFSRLEELFEQGIITENELKYQQEEILKKYSDQ